MFSIRAISIYFIATAGFVAFQTTSLALPFSLGTAGPGNFTVLEIGTGTLNISINAGGPANGITGNVGVNGTGTLSLTGTTFVHGNVFLASGAKKATSGSGTISGTTFDTGQDAFLTQAASDATTASS